MVEKQKASLDDRTRAFVEGLSPEVQERFQGLRTNIASWYSKHEHQGENTGGNLQFHPWQLDAMSRALMAIDPSDEEALLVVGFTLGYAAMKASLPDR